MASKKMYDQVAKNIREVRYEAETTSPGHTARLAAREASTKIAYGMVAIFTEDNPRFDATKFLVACGIPVKGH